MPTSILTKSNKAYDTLLIQVRATLVEGQKRIESQRVRTYWETGQLINKHILKNSQRAEYGGEVIRRLVTDLDVDKTTLHDCVLFAKKYPRLSIVGGRPQFKWTHFRELIRVPDDKDRLRLEATAQRNAWTSEELIARIKAERIDAAQEVEEPESKPSLQEILKPLRGELFTYKIVQRPTLGTSGEEGLLLDLGFGVFREVDKRVLAQFKEGDIVQSRPKEDSYKFTKKEDATERELYTYQAFIEKVVDGDTIKVRFDLGFETWQREILRLRGLDCAEMDTKEGVSAKAFVQSYIKEAQMVIVRSSKSDKYDRYLADVFIPQDSQGATPDDLFLNNMLLENGYAVRMS